jgi:tRNA (mo5U34)-methyltransferase
VDAEALKVEIRRLGPWHHEIEVVPGVSTALARDETYPDEYGKVSFLDMRQSFRSKLLSVYPRGLESRSVLDCGCNCGESLFWAKEMGAGQCYGFDAREHWIAQGRFLAEHSRLPSEGVTLEVRDLYEIPSIGLSAFDIVLFHGLLYHLPEPVTGLKIAGDLAKELIVVSTSTAAGLPDGLLQVGQESRTQLLSGIHGLNWYPSGPEVVARILAWIGFVEWKLLWWTKETGGGLGRLELVASKTSGLLKSATRL